jgi:hypothetical protein
MARYKSPAVRRQIAYSLLCSGYVTEDGDHHYITDEGVAALIFNKPKAKAAKPAKKEKQKKLPAAPARIGKAKKPAEAKSKTPAKAPTPKKAPAADDAKSDKPAEGRQLLINLMSRKEGATAQQMVDATGWQKGAVFGTISKIKKLLAPRNQTVTPGKGDDGKLVYKIAGQAA